MGKVVNKLDALAHALVPKLRAHYDEVTLGIDQEHEFVMLSLKKGKKSKDITLDSAIVNAMLSTDDGIDLVVDKVKEAF